MPRVNMDNTPEEKVFDLVPVGKYIAQVDDIEEVFTKNNDPMWKVKLKLVDPNFPELMNQKLFDNWVFNFNAMNRIKLIAKSFGLPYKGEVDIREEDVLGKEVVVIVKHEIKPDKYGEKVKRAVIPFNGYEAYVEEGAEPTTVPETKAPVKVVKKSGLSASVPPKVTPPVPEVPATTPPSVVKKTVVKKVVAPPPPPPPEEEVVQYVDEAGNPVDEFGNPLTESVDDFGDVPF